MRCRRESSVRDSAVPESERDALRQVAVRMQGMLTAKGISEDELLTDFKKWRAGSRK